MYELPFFVKLKDSFSGFADPETGFNVAGPQTKLVENMSPLIRQWLMTGALKECNQDGSDIVYVKAVVAPTPEAKSSGIDGDAGDWTQTSDGTAYPPTVEEIAAAQKKLDDAKAKSVEDAAGEQEAELDLEALLRGDGSTGGGDAAGKGKTTPKSGK